MTHAYDEKCAGCKHAQESFLIGPYCEQIMSFMDTKTRSYPHSQDWMRHPDFGPCGLDAKLFEPKEKP